MVSFLDVILFYFKFVCYFIVEGPCFIHTLRWNNMDNNISFVDDSVCLFFWPSLEHSPLVYSSCNIEDGVGCFALMVLMTDWKVITEKECWETQVNNPWLCDSRSLERRWERLSLAANWRHWSSLLQWICTLFSLHQWLMAMQGRNAIVFSLLSMAKK